MMQLIHSSGTEFFSKIFTVMYNLKNVNKYGYNSYEPCLFYGMYFNEDSIRLMEHRGQAIILWAGSDIRSKGQPFITKNTPTKVLHLAASPSIEQRLKRVGFSYRRIPNIAFTNWDYWKPEPLGEKIYFYAPSDFYGLNCLDQIKEFGYPVIHIDRAQRHDISKLRNIYKECFIGLRLTPEDGNSATVLEMGLMGRKTIWNGDQLSAIPWNDFDKLNELICVEAKKIGTSQDAFAKKVYDSVTKTTEGWFDV